MRTNYPVVNVDVRVSQQQLHDLRVTNNTSLLQSRPSALYAYMLAERYEKKRRYNKKMHEHLELRSTMKTELGECSILYSDACMCVDYRCKVW